MDREAAGAVVRSRGWLASTSDEFQQALLGRAELLRIPKGTILYHAGDEPAGLYGVAAGLIAVSLPPREPEESLIHLRGPGFWAGDGAALLGIPRLVALAAARDTWCWRLSRAAVQAMLADDPSRWRWFGGISVHNVAEALALIDALTTLDPGRRLAKLLLRLTVTEADGRITVPASQAEIGTMAGLTRKMVHNVLRGFERRGWINRCYGTVEIIDLQQLRLLAEKHMTGTQ